ncbi:MAG: formate dehydrogenase accessory sulfurtransferase FdhD, partial [Pseudomonadota bacterium]
LRDGFSLNQGLEVLCPLGQQRLTLLQRGAGLFDRLDAHAVNERLALAAGVLRFGDLVITVDKIAGWMFASGENADDKLFYTTGRLTSEMVMKTAMMGVPVLASRSGFTASGVEIARQVGLTLIGRMRGKRFVCLAGEDRLIYDADPSAVEDERPEHGRKGSRGD